MIPAVFYTKPYNLSVTRPWQQCKQRNLSIQTLPECCITPWKSVQTESTQLSNKRKPKLVPFSKRSQHNLAQRWWAVWKWWSGGEVREGIYSILIVGELQARPFNTSNFTSKWNNVADSAFFLWLNCLGDSRGQKLKKYMSTGKEKLSGCSAALSGISLCLAGT